MAIATLSALYASAQVTSVYDVTGSVGTYNEITGGTVLTGLPAGEDLNEKVFDGTGKPLGIFNQTGGADVGVTAASATAITSDELIDLFYSLNSAYRKKPSGF